MGRLKLLGEQEGGGTDDHSALSNLDYAQSGHSGFVPSQGEALIDILRLNQNIIRDSAGNDRITLSAASPHLTLTGATKISERAAIGGVAINNNALLALQPASPPTTAYFYGVTSAPFITVPSGVGSGVIAGLQFAGTVSGGGGGATINDVLAVSGKVGAFGYTGTIQRMRNFLGAVPFIGAGAPVIDMWAGLELEAINIAYIADAYGLKVGDITNNTGFARLLEIGPDAPYLRLLGGTDPPVNKSNLYLKFGSTLYRVVKTGEYMTLEAA